MNNFICLFLPIVAACYLLIYLPFMWRSPQRSHRYHPDESGSIRRKFM